MGRRVKFLACTIGVMLAQVISGYDASAFDGIVWGAIITWLSEAD